MRGFLFAVLAWALALGASAFAGPQGQLVLVKWAWGDGAKMDVRKYALAWPFYKMAAAKKYTPLQSPADAIADLQKHNVEANKERPVLLKIRRIIENETPLYFKVLSSITAALEEIEVVVKGPTFEELDKNKDRVLALQELQALEELASTTDDTKTINDAFTKTDANKDGLLDHDEILAALQEMDRTLESELIGDKNNDGKLSFEEIIADPTPEDGVDDSPSEDMLKTMTEAFAEADTDKDGYLTSEEINAHALIVYQGKDEL